jgi:hypothetical protein
MARRKMASLPLQLDDELQPKKLPKNLTPDWCEQIHTKHFGPGAGRTIRERWPLKWRHVNGKAVTDRDEFLAEAQRRFDAAAVIMGGVKAYPEFDHAAN